MQYYFHKISVRNRYLFSFLLIAVIPICIILTSFYRFNVEELRLDIEDINVKRITQIQLGFENEIMKHYSLASAIYQDQSLIPLMKQERLSSNYNALLLFRQYLSYRDINSYTSIYLTTKDQVYNKTGIMTHDVYFENMLQLDGTQTKDIISAISNKPYSDTNTMLSAKRKDGSQIIICAYNIPTYITNPYAILITVIEHEQIMKLFSLIFNEIEGTAFILNSRQELIFHTDIDDSIKDYFDNAILSIDYTDTEQKIHPIKVNNKNYSIIHSKSNVTGIIYGVLAEESTYLTKVRKQTELVWQTSLLALSICIIASVFLTLLSYKPIKELLLLTKKDALNGKWCDEYSQIRFSILNSTNRLDKLEMMLELQRPYILEHILGYALYSKMTPVQLHELLKSMDIHFDHSFFFVACVKALRNRSSKPTYSHFKTMVIDTVNMMSTPKCKYYTLERFDEDEIIIVINCDNSDERRDYILKLQQRLNKVIGNEYFFVIGVGSICNTVEDLKTSLYEASVLVQTQTDNPTAFIEDKEVVSRDYSCMLPTTDINLFKLQLKQGDELNAKLSFTRLCEMAEDSAHSYLSTRFIYTYIAIAIMETIQQVNYTNFNIELQQLMMFKSPESFKEAAETLIKNFCQYINDNKQNKNTILRDQILEYINKNISDINLSLESIAERFNLSTYYVSRFFRDQNNINLKDYITELRISKAKELLATTDYSISDIVNKIGYISVSSFIRKFKSIEGITPGEYRVKYTQ